MCGGGGATGGTNRDRQESYVDRLSKTIESNLAREKAGPISGGSLYGGGGGADRDRQGGPSVGQSPVGGGGGNRDNIRDSGRSYNYVSTPAPVPRNEAQGSGMGRGGEDVGRLIGGGGISMLPSGGGAGYDYVSTPAPIRQQPPGISTQFGPRGGAPLGGTGTNYNPALTRAAIAIQGFEGFVPKAFYDVNAPRVGWSSDTITDPITGQQRRVTMDDTISVQDANVDLNARIVGIQNTLAEKIGQDAWDNLPVGAKAAMTSVGYQYGSVPRSVISAAKSGDPKSISKSISELESTPSRRAAEAKISLSDKVINAGLNMIPGIISPALGAASLASSALGGPSLANMVRGIGNEKITPTDPGSITSEDIGYGPYGNLTREQYRDQYGGRDQAQEAPRKKEAIEPVAPVVVTTPAALPTITPQPRTAPVAPGTTPNTRKLSNEEYAALSPLEKAYYDMGISTYGTFTPEYNFFPDRQPIYLREPVIAPEEKNKIREPVITPEEKNKKRNGGLVKGPGTETSDSVPALIGGKTPAALSDGEFVFTGRAVRGMGNGDRMEGARKLHQMMKKAEGNASKGSPRK